VPAAAALALSAASGPASLLLWASIWGFAGIGLAELSGAVSDRARLPSTLAVGLLLVLLQAQAWQQRDIPPPHPYGHERLSTTDFLRSVSKIPEVTLVTEDASSNLVFRAAFPRMHRLGKRPQILQADVNAMKAAGTRQYSPVLALQRAQQLLQHRGVQFRPAAPQSPLAATVAIQPCVPVSDVWRDAPGLAHNSRFAFVAREEAARGPIAVYVGSVGPLQPRPLGRPGQTIRGFWLVRYTRDARPDLREALEAQGIPTASPLLTAAHVVRLVLWRTPGAPRVLPVDLERPADAVVTRVDQGGLPLSVDLCPSFEYAPSAW
jgi:hypothetical protein